MPRGVAVPDVRQHLFAAVERVLERDGAGRLSTRAVTGEARVATGLLYTHFAGLDDFLTGYAVDRSFQLAAEASGLLEKVGTGDVVDNLAQTIGSWNQLSGFVRLIAARPDVLAGVRDVLGQAGSGLDALGRVVGEYLAVEQRVGRISVDADPQGLAVAVTAVIHHHALTAPARHVRQRLRIALTAVVEGRISAVD